jgi:gamma-glutamylcyclotransferase
MPPDQQPTLYFSYGSNLWLHQMSTRCPSSPYTGIARLKNYTWIINDRGYANVISSSSTSLSSSPSKYTNEVYGLVYTLTPSDKSQLDKNEGVPLAYTKETLPCDFWPSNTSHRVDTSKSPEEKKDMLVYIDRKRITPDEPRKEYVYRMNQGIADAIKLGVPKGYVKEVMRKYIPVEEEDGEVAEFARGQAAEFRDESGVIQ